uniref:SPK domain-containing protein n=2 Tax=Caenorhabditis japonica TaxID=281687 RepID=A0A8R1IGH4_CAEJA
MSNPMKNKGLFTPEEDWTIWKWIRDAPEPIESMTKLWEEFKVAKNCERSVKGLTSRFRNHLLHRLHSLRFDNLTKLKLYKKLRAPIDQNFYQRMLETFHIQLNVQGVIVEFSPKFSTELNELKRPIEETSNPLIPLKKACRVESAQNLEEEEMAIGELGVYNLDFEDEEETEQTNNTTNSSVSPQLSAYNMQFLEPENEHVDKDVPQSSNTNQLSASIAGKLDIKNYG